MSNKRRKSIGTAKLKRNRAMRVIRGALKAGAPLPGDGGQFQAPDGWALDGRLEAQGKALRDEVEEMRGIIRPCHLEVRQSGRLTRVGVAG